MTRRSSSKVRIGPTGIALRAGAAVICALACTRASAPPGPPVPASVDPSTAYAGVATPVLLRGDGFYAEATQLIGGGSHISAGSPLRAFLGQVELSGVSFIDSRTLSATIPASLPPGDYSLTVQGPYGSGTAPDAFHAIAGAPASLTAVATAPPRALTGQEIAIAVDVSNIGATTAAGVAAGAATATGPSVTLQPPAEIVDIAGGEEHGFAWRAQASAPGMLNLTLPVAGKDAAVGSPLTASASASILVVTPAHLVATPRPAPPSQPAGPEFQLALDVVNDGGSDALAVDFAPLSGMSGTVEVVSAPAPQDVPAGTMRTFVWTIRGTTDGTAPLTCNGAGVDATDGSAVSVGPSQWTVIIFTAVALLYPTLTIPPGALPNETFPVSLTLDNPGVVDALNVQLSVSVSGSGSVSLASAPAGADVPAGTSATFVWTYKANGTGQVQFDVLATGTDARSGNPVTASGSDTTVIATAAPVAIDPFGDGSSFAYVFSYANHVYLAPSQDGTRGVRMKYDGTAPEVLHYGFLTDPSGVKNSVSPLPAAFPSLGFLGCAPDTLGCGPDDEDGRGLFTSAVVNGKEWLFAAGSRRTSILKHVYLSTDFTALPSFQYLQVNPTGGTRGTTAAAGLGAALYVGFADAAGTGMPVLLKMTGFPADSTQPLSLSITDAQAPSVPLHSPAGTGLIDSMAAFGGWLYAANDGGCARYNGSSWGNCTPTSATWTGKTAISTTKSTDFVPADKAVPQMAAFNGRLYMARNTTSGPQLWVCNPSSNVCTSGTGSWTILPNQNLDATLTQMDDSSLTTVSLLVASSQSLYVGYDSAAGARLYRSKTSSPSNTNDFSAVTSAGLGAGLTQILDGQALTTDGREFLYVVARAGTSTAKVYRLAP